MWESLFKLQSLVELVTTGDRCYCDDVVTGIREPELVKAPSHLLVSDPNKRLNLDIQAAVNPMVLKCKLQPPTFNPI